MFEWGNQYKNDTVILNNAIISDLYFIKNLAKSKKLIKIQDRLISLISILFVKIMIDRKALC